jgi:diguanylate cyclase (GGDEF)-like protein
VKTGIGERRRLIVLIGLLLVFGFAGTSFFGFMASRQALSATISENELPVTSDTVYSEIQRDLVRPIFVSSMMASDTFLRDWILDGEKTPEDMIKYLSEVLRKYGAFTSFLVSDRSRLYYQSDRVLKSVSEAEPRDAWYFRVMALSAPYEINVDRDLAHADALTVFINYRVLDYKGGFLGAAGIGINVAAIGGMTADYRQKFGRSVYLVDKAGKIVAGMPGGIDALPLSATPADIHSIEGLSGIASSVLSADRGSFQYRRAGKKWLLNVRDVEELGWKLFVEKDEGAALEGISEALGLNLAICAAITALVLLITSLTINRFQFRLERTATTDGLTGLLTRPALGLLAIQAFKEMKRDGRPLCLVIADLDNFKSINDGFGHQAGDTVLARSTAALRTCLRDSDLACRWGGEEFLVILRSCPLAEALSIAEKVRAAIASAEPGPLRITASLGVAEWTSGEDFDSLVRRADAALYRAKAEGRDRACAAPAIPDS